MNTPTSRQDGARPAWLPLLLGAGDALVFIAFAALGRASHNLPAESPLLATLLVAAPFAAAWAVVAPLMAAFGREARALASPWRWLAHTALTWLIAGPLGLALRLLLFRRPFILSFALVTMAVVAAMMLAWRGLFWLINKRLVAW
jgi:hypothetical protein